MTRNIQRHAKLRETIARSYAGYQASQGDLNYIERHLSRYATTMEFLPTTPGKLLDVGSFPGHTSVLAKEQGWSVTGISKLDEMFVGHEFVDRMHQSDIPILDVDMERGRIPVDAETFDCVFFNEIIEHLPYNPYHALDQVWRVLKPGGRLVFSVPNLASFDHIWALLRGRSFYPELTRPLEEAYHADIGQRHIREYTLQECKYLLTQQDKYLYRFKIDSVVMDRSWDGLFYTEHGCQRSLRQIRPGTLLRSIVTRISRNYRSNIFILAHKPHDYLSVPGIPVETGFYPPEDSGVSPSFIRAPLRSRWMKPAAQIEIQIPQSVTAVRQVDILMWMPAPSTAGTLRVEPRIDDCRCESLDISPSAEPRRRILKPSRPLPRDENNRNLLIHLKSTAWNPKRMGIEDHDRSLGPMLYTEQIGITA